MYLGRQHYTGYIKIQGTTEATRKIFNDFDEPEKVSLENNINDERTA